MLIRNGLVAVWRRGGELCALMAALVAATAMAEGPLPGLESSLPLALPSTEILGLPAIDTSLLGGLNNLLQLPELVLPTIPTLPLLGDIGGLASGLGLTLLQLEGEQINPLAGTESFQGSISHGGQTRRYVGVRPVGAAAGAPVLLLLHPLALKPARMANLTRASRLAAMYGAWVYLPEANGSSWNDDPTGLSLGGSDDVGFLDALIRREVAAHGLDGKRVYAAGYSNGGYMAERLVCERPAQFAGLAMVAATLRSSVAAACTNVGPMPMLMFSGTSDLISLYGGGIPTLSSAPAAAEFWSLRNGCSAGYDESTLPNIAPKDGTTVTLRRYRNCVDSEVQLYRINGGGHTWPGTTYAGYTIALGATSFDIDATLALWQVLIPFAKP